MVEAGQKVEYWIAGKGAEAKPVKGEVLEVGVFQGRRILRIVPDLEALAGTWYAEDVVEAAVRESDDGMDEAAEDQGPTEAGSGSDE